MLAKLARLRYASLSIELASGRETRLALGVVLVSAVIFLAMAPFAKMPLAQVPAFIPIYESALVICDLITAVLLFGQFGFLRSRALFVVACGYLFTASVTVLHALTFPGVFSPAGLLGAGPQSTAWMYTFWHGGFPIVVIAYALLKDGGRAAVAGGALPRPPIRLAILGGVAAVLAVACGLTLIATAGHAFLPAILEGNRITASGQVILSSSWVLALVALAVLWRRRPHTVLDLWLMVVMCAWLFDIALSAIVNGGRYDLGWYAGRIYGLLSATFLLAVLLTETGEHYARSVYLIALESAKSVAENASLAKSEFLSRMSHELRTPLNAILGFTQLLEAGSPPPTAAQKGSIDQVLKAGWYLLGLVDKILDLAQIESGKLVLSPEPTSLTGILRECRTEIEPQAQKRGIRTTFPGFEVPCIVEADPIRLKAALLELLANAVRFSSAGGAVGLDCATNSPGRIRISISDTGRGFTPEDLAKLFQPFRSPANEAAVEEGIGIGLMVSKLMVEMMGGELGATSSAGKGSVFWIELNLAARPQPAAGAIAPKAYA
jgi:signal transduction histidine kinase